MTCPVTGAVVTPVSTVHAAGPLHLRHPNASGLSTSTGNHFDNCEAARDPLSLFSPFLWCRWWPCSLAPTEIARQMPGKQRCTESEAGAFCSQYCTRSFWQRPAPASSSGLVQVLDEAALKCSASLGHHTRKVRLLLQSHPRQTIVPFLLLLRLQSPVFGCGFDLAY